MLIHFNYLKFKNILRYGSQETYIDFQNGIDLILGKNGSGKSTIIEALNYGLFGKPFRKIKVGDLINDINKKNLLVEISFTINEKVYKIIRGQKPNIFEIYENDRLIDQKPSSKDYQEYLEEKILKINENIFKQLIALGANIQNSKNFIDLTPKEKEEILQILTDTSIFDILLEKTKEKKKHYKELLEKTKYRYDTKKESYVVLKQKIDEIKKHNDKIKNERETILKRLKEEKTKYNNEITQLNKNLKNLQETEKELTEKKNNLKNKLSKLHNVNEKFYLIDKKLKENEKEKKCPNCGYLLNEDLNTLKEKYEKLKKAKEAKEKLENALDKIEEKLESISFNIYETKTKIKNLQLKIEHIEKEEKNLQTSKLIKIDKSELIELNKELKSLKTDLENYKKEYNDYTELEKIFSLKNLKSEVLKRKLPILNNLINKYLQKYNIPYGFIITPELKDEVIFRNNSKNFQSLSNGQKQRIVLSILFSFLELVELGGVTTNILFLDEFLDSSLDDEGIEKTIEILNDIAKKKNVFIISHNDKIKNEIDYSNLFNRCFKIETFKGFSKLSKC